MTSQLYQGVTLSEWPLGTNVRAAAINSELFPTWRAAGYAVIDQRTINLIGKKTDPLLYEDHIHFPGPLTAAALHMVLSITCGDTLLELVHNNGTESIGAPVKR